MEDYNNTEAVNDDQRKDDVEGLTKEFVSSDTFANTRKEIINEVIEKRNKEELFNSLPNRYKTLSEEAPKVLDNFNSSYNNDNYTFDQIKKHEESLIEMESTLQSSIPSIKKTYSNNGSMPKDFDDLIKRHDEGESFDNHKLDKQGFIINTQRYEDAYKDISVVDFENLYFHDGSKSSKSLDKFLDAQDKIESDISLIEQNSLKVI